MEKPSVWIVGHYGTWGGRLALASQRVAGGTPGRPDYQARLDAAAAKLPGDMRGCTHKVLARTASQAAAVFTEYAAYYCTDAGHASDMRRIMPSG